MRILVTGATGRVGRRFVPRLLQQRDPVRVLVRDEARAAAGAEVLVGDLREPADVDRALDGVDAVVHLGAAFRGVDDAEAVAVNRDATVQLGDAARRAGVARFVHVSTTLVYGPGRGRPAEEADAPAPQGLGAYPVSKAEAERALLRKHREEGLALRILRLGFVYGDGDAHLQESLLWARGWPLHQRLHLVHHADVAQALIRALRTDGVGLLAVETQQLAGGQRRVVGDVVDRSVDAADRALEDPWIGIFDVTRIRRELGFRPIHPTVYAAADAGAL
jgi:nucleoside-diphosphate-sugar epimerase